VGIVADGILIGGGRVVSPARAKAAVRVPIIQVD